MMDRTPNRNRNHLTKDKPMNEPTPSTTPEAPPATEPVSQPATPPTPSTPDTVTPITTSPTTALPPAPHPQTASFSQRLRLQHFLERLDETPPLPPPNDMLLEITVKLTGHDGVVVDHPIHLPLPGALSPAFIAQAATQFETLLDQLLIKPVTIAFIAHLESRKLLASPRRF